MVVVVIADDTAKPASESERVAEAERVSAETGDISWLGSPNARVPMSETLTAGSPLPLHRVRQPEEKAGMYVCTVLCAVDIWGQEMCIRCCSVERGRSVAMLPSVAS